MSAATPFESVEDECAFWKEQAHIFEREASRLRGAPEPRKVWRPAHERQAADIERIRAKYDWPRGEYKNPDIEILLRCIDSLRGTHV